jgi:hypothetical protein
VHACAGSSSVFLSLCEAHSKEGSDSDSLKAHVL